MKEFPIYKAAVNANIACANHLIDGEPAGTEDVAVQAIVASQRANGESIDPAGARKLVRALAAVGLLKFD